MAIEKFNIRLPNYFGSIALYFMILLFLFTNPKFANTKRKLYIYRACAIIPILFIMITTTVSIGYSYQKGGFANLDELLKLSDQRMYKVKADYYQVTGRDRRKN